MTEEQARAAAQKILWWYSKDADFLKHPDGHWVLTGDYGHIAIVLPNGEVKDLTCEPDYCR